MSHGTIAIIGTAVNFILAVAKLMVGLTINSIALIADAIHSGLDVFSSFVTFLGIKAAQKPVDKEHPYGHYRFESLAGFVVAFILGISGVWILFEGVNRFFESTMPVFSFWAIILMAVFCVPNEIMARLKFHYGHKHQSLALVADAEHSRADVISSLGVLASLILIKYFVFADVIIALLIGFYILKQSFSLGKEITDSLLDVANPILEKKVREICSAYKIEISGLKTRRIGLANFAELKIKLDSKLKIDAATKITNNLEAALLKNIPQLKYIVISVESHEIKRGVISSKLGKNLTFKKGFEPIGPEKLGERTIVPLENNEISGHFGVAEYLVVDKGKDEKILLKEYVKNPYFEEEAGHGIKFAKAISADKAIVCQIGPNAKKNLEANNIKLEILPSGQKPFGLK